jgi:hypothetical protein
MTTHHGHGQCVPECTEDQSAHLADAVWVEPDATAPEEAFDEMVQLGQEIDPVEAMKGRGA